MKTTDLIPIILYQLVDGDKYGYEIVKQIEDSSNGGIVIKQPTLYGVLKKLEQGKFISSYWQDSEIGGKRHYYKLTDNGKAQLDTYPPFDTLIKDALESEGVASFSPTLSKDDTIIETSPIIEPSIANTYSIKEEVISPTVESFSVDEIKPIHIDLTLTKEEQLEKAYSPNLSTQIADNIEKDNVSENLDDITNDYDYLPNYTSQESLSSINLTQDANTSFKIENETVYNEDVSSSESLFNVQEDVIPITPINITLDNTITTEESKATYPSIFDAIDYDNDSYQDEIKENTPSPTIDEQNHLDSNISVVDQSINLEENETSNLQPKFTEKVESLSEPYVVNKLYDKLSPNPEIVTHNSQGFSADSDLTSVNQIEEVKYLNYVDFSTDKNVIKRRKTITKHIQKMSLTCLSLLLMFALSIVLCSKYSFSKLYYISTIIVCFIVLLYPIILITNIHKIRFKYCSQPFKYSISRDFFIKLSLFLSIIVAIFAYNLTVVNNIGDIFIFNNCANFLCPILFSCVIILDFVFSVVIYKDYK